MNDFDTLPAYNVVETNNSDIPRQTGTAFSAPLSAYMAAKELMGIVGQ